MDWFSGNCLVMDASDKKRTMYNTGRLKSHVLQTVSINTLQGKRQGKRGQVHFSSFSLR